MEPVRDKSVLDREFSDFYREHLRDVYNYTYYRTGNHHDAEDLTTQTFLQAYRHFERAQREANGRPLRPWLIRIAHNLAANYYRDRSRKPTSALNDTEVEPHDTEDLVVGREEAVTVLEGVRAISVDADRQKIGIFKPKCGKRYFSFFGKYVVFFRFLYVCARIGSMDLFFN